MTDGRTKCRFIILGMVFFRKSVVHARGNFVVGFAQDDAVGDEEVLPYMNIYPDEKKTGVNKGYDVTGSKDSSQYTGKHNGTKSRNEKKKKN